ncbi:MAG: Nramp family divalent metal transporter [Candidatus Thermoplasmatota archaeon]
MKKENEENKKIKFPEPNKLLTAKPSLKKYLKYLLFFGPGAVVASMTIGQGQLIFGPQIGGWAGFSLLWLITINIGSYIIAYVGCRFTMLSGIGVMDLFAFKTRKGWLNWLFMAIMLFFIPIFTASIITTLGQSLAWVTGFGHYLWWGIGFCLLAGILVMGGRYKMLEFTQVFFVAVLGIGALVSVLVIAPNLVEVIPNFFTIGNVPSSFPDYPNWVMNDYPGVASTPIPLAMLGYLGTLTFTIITLVGYTGWIKVKKWGIFRGRDDSESFSQNMLNSLIKYGKIRYLSEKKEDVKKSRISLKPLLIDLSLAFLIVSVVSASYMISGAELLQPRHTLPEDTRLIQEQVKIFTYLADWLKPLFQISVVFALFGTVYAGFEAATRMLYETGRHMHKKIKNIRYKRFMLFLLVYLLSTGIPISILMYRGLSVLAMLSLTLMFIGVVGVVMYGVGIVYLSQKVLPDKYKLGGFALAASIIGIFLLMIPIFFLFSLLI